MKALCLFTLLGASFAQSQPAPPPAEKGDTVIARFVEDGGTLTLDEYNGLLQLRPGWQGRPREEVIHKYAILRKFAQLAQEKKLNEQSPFKEQLKAILDFDILYNMADFLVQDTANGITVDHSEIEKYYNDHKDIYKQVTVSGLKVAFGGSVAPVDNDHKAGNASRPVKKVLTEEEAKAKAEKLVADIRAGADFGKLVLLESDDETNRTKGGELGTWKMTDNVPDLMREKVLGMNAGDVSDPVQQGPGFYIFHADAVTYTPLKEVEDSIFAAVKQQHIQDWLQTMDKSIKVEFPTRNEPLPAPSEPKK
jgi:parvulin-like peptidyl-prolyl isomerase